MRGDIYEYKAPKATRGHEQAGARFAVVVQSDDLPLSTCIVAPTSTSARPGPVRPEITVLGRETRVLVEQLAPIDPQSRLGAFVGRLGTAELQAVDRALLAVLALD